VNELTELEITHAFAQRAEHLPPKHVKIDQHPWIAGALSEGRTLRVHSIEDVPADAAVEREYMLEQGFKATLFIPMLAGDSVVGAISYSDMNSEREWTDDLVEQLSVISQLFGEALLRKETGQILAASQEQFRAFMDNNPAGAYIKGADLRHMYANRLLLERFGISVDEFIGSKSSDLLGDPFRRRPSRRGRDLR
jgi:PAS domain-containing protein